MTKPDHLSDREWSEILLTVSCQTDGAIQRALQKRAKRDKRRRANGDSAMYCNLATCDRRRNGVAYYQ